MRISPLDIQQKQFRRKLRGCDPEEVQIFLELVRTEFEEIVKENNVLRDELRRRLSEIDDYKDRERTLKDTMLTAQRITEDIKENAKKDGQLVVAEAQVQADRIVGSAHARMVKLVEEIAELRRQRTQYESGLRSLIESHRTLLDVTVEGTEAEQQEAGQVEFFPRSTAKTSS